MSKLPSDVNDQTERTRVVLIGVGGASCSGKTTIASLLHTILPNSRLIHQDDQSFAPPSGLIPIHPKYNVPDWERAETSIEWPKFRQFLQNLKAKDNTPVDYVNHEGWTDSVAVSQETVVHWQETLGALDAKLRQNGSNIEWGIVEGFLLYWHPDVIEPLDIRLFLRGDNKTMKARRELRETYGGADGYMWRDPPEYWDNLVWPAYLEAHQRMFIDGNVNGEAIEPVPTSSRDDSTNPSSFGGPVANLIVLPAENASIQDLFDLACNKLETFMLRLLDEH
ncbi:hypothetical protein M408DRAFT_80281 [Serendipita vermifera MAFF 305830]|uniref:Phosphoribulokinase/uridine kinase domain-containing protein n=1 Tax=Serendipita vermifera MAFF 305830 TaxID=933852 RepID=A0A0C3AAJ3_SERVB|nr:hypothetical protein M408DRAFT_80281 [Serendipita vermifera MAFF 305830]